MYMHDTEYLVLHNPSSHNAFVQHVTENRTCKVNGNNDNCYDILYIWDDDSLVHTNTNQAIYMFYVICSICSMYVLCTLCCQMAL